MALSYADKRGRFAGMNPADFVPGTPKFDNPVKLVVAAPTVARREATAPRERFRTTTKPLTAEEQELLLNPPPVPKLPAWDAVPEQDTWTLDT